MSRDGVSQLALIFIVRRGKHDRANLSLLSVRYLPAFDKMNACLDDANGVRLHPLNNPLIERGQCGRSD